MRYIFNTVALFFLFPVSLFAQIPGRPPAQTIPNFQFFRFNNTSFTDKDMPQGKIIFFMFFDSDCDHCQRAIKSIGDQYQAFKKAAVFLISIDDQNKINRFMDTYGSKLKGQKNVTLLHDTQNEFIYKFKPKKYPSLFLYSQQQTLMMYDDDEKSLDKFLEKIRVATK